MKASTMQGGSRRVSASEQKEAFFEGAEDDLGLGCTHVVCSASEDEPPAHKRMDACAFLWCAGLSASSPRARRNVQRVAAHGTSLDHICHLLHGAQPAAHAGWVRRGIEEGDRRRKAAC